MVWALLIYRRDFHSVFIRQIIIILILGGTAGQKMNLIDKIKRILVGEERSEKDDGKEKIKAGISLRELRDKIEERSKTLSESEESVRKRILNRLRLFYAEVTSARSGLESIDLAERKEQERIKIIVRENLNLYTSHLDRLIERLKKSSGDAEEYTRAVFSSINDFKKSARMSFDKATILIGKELELVRSTVRELESDLKEVMRESRDPFETRATVNSLQKYLKEIDEVEDSSAQTNNQINDTNEKIDKAKKRRHEFEKEMIEIKDGEDYKMDNAAQAERKKRLERLESEIISIKRKIDFKALSRVFHQDKKKHQLVLEYQSDFKSALLEDESLGIMKLAAEALNLDLQELHKLKLELLELNKPTITKTDQKLSSLEEEKKRVETEVNSLEASLDYEQKMKDKLATKRNQLLNEMTQAAKALFPEIELVEN